MQILLNISGCDSLGLDIPLSSIFFHVGTEQRFEVIFTQRQLEDIILLFHKQPTRAKLGLVAI